MNSFRQGPVRGDAWEGASWGAQSGGVGGGWQVGVKMLEKLVTGEGRGGRRGGKEGKSEPRQKIEDGVYAQRFSNRKGVFPVFDQIGRSWTQTTGQGRTGVAARRPGNIYQAMQLRQIGFLLHFEGSGYDICLSVCLFASLFVYFVCLYVCMYLCMLICLHVHMFVCLHILYVCMFAGM